MAGRSGRMFDSSVLSPLSAYTARSGSQVARTPSDSASIVQAVHGGTTMRPFIDEVPRMLKERNLSLRALARKTGVTDSHLSRVLRLANYKSPSPN